SLCSPDLPQQATQSEPDGPSPAPSDGDPRDPQVPAVPQPSDQSPPPAFPWIMPSESGIHDPINFSIRTLGADDNNRALFPSLPRCPGGERLPHQVARVGALYFAARPYDSPGIDIPRVCRIRNMLSASTTMVPSSAATLVTRRLANAPMMSGRRVNIR